MSKLASHAQLQIDAVMQCSAHLSLQDPLLLIPFQTHARKIHCQVGEVVEVGCKLQSTLVLEMGKFPLFSTVGEGFVLFHNVIQPALHYAIPLIANSIVRFIAF
jgi:hypothetical protein